MEPAIYGAFGIVAAIGTCLAACATKSLREFSRADLEAVCQRRNRMDRLSAILRLHEPVALSSESLQNVGLALTVWLGFLWIRATAVTPADSSDGTVWPVLFVELVVAAAVLLICQSWIPWTLVRLGSEGFLERTWPLWYHTSQVLRPLIAAARALDWLIFWGLGREQKKLSDESFEDEIRTVVTEGHREGLIENDEREMIEGVIELADVEVSEVMTPRTDMVCISHDLTLTEALEFVATSRHTRIPVYERTRDNIIGILHVKDLLAAVARSMKPPAAATNGRHGHAAELVDILQEPPFVPEGKRINQLLHEFRSSRKHLAIVLDEFGGVAGLVTIEDILEEIVGEIVDEHDESLVDGIRELDASRAEALGRVRIDEINERLNLELPEEGDFDTIGGFVFSTLGYVPAVGESMTWENIRITVLEATRRRIERVRIEQFDTEPSEAA